MKKRLVILSDLWGKTNSNWEKECIDYLQSMFEVCYYDSGELGNVDKSIYTQDALHQQFINGGIENAVNELLKLEQGEINVLAFSIGGTIGWKAALKGLNIKQLIAISATRLRYETIKPNSEIQLYFGEEDIYQPTESWFKSLMIDRQLIENGKHDIYQNMAVIRAIFS